MTVEQEHNPYTLLGKARELHRRERFADAEPIYREVLDEHPEQPDALHLLGLLCHQTGRQQQAEELIRQAIGCNDSAAGFHNTLGAVLKSKGEWDQAEIALRKALTLNSELSTAWANLAEVLLAVNRLEEANEALQNCRVEVSRRILLSHLRKRLRSGGLDEFDAVLRIAETLHPDDVEFEAAGLFRSNFDETFSPEQQQQLQQDWVEKHFPQATAEAMNPYTPAPHVPFSGTTPSRERIRIAYVGTYLHLMFLEKILRHHDPERFELFLLTDDGRIDAEALNGRMAVVPFSEIDPVRFCRERDIQIAVDLVGPFPFLNGMRQFSAFQQRLAPVQCGWIATTGTTGSRAIDYLPADPFLIEAEQESLYVEQIARLPEVCHCWTPPADAPSAGPLPALQNGYVTFGSANRGFKLHEAQLSAWAEILERVPGSRIHFKGLHCSDRDFVSRTTASFVEKGIDSHRLDFAPFASHPEFLEFYRGIDIALDTYPYNGGITTLESLWMGVPVVTRTGRRFVSRVTGSYLRCLHRESWMAATREEYVRKTCELAGDVARLEAERKFLRNDLAESVICDGRRFTRQLEDLYEQLLRDHGRSPVPVDTGTSAGTVFRSH